MREIRRLLNSAHSFSCILLQQVWIIPWDRRLSFSGPSFCSICHLYLSVYRLCLSRCERKCFDSCSGVSWPEKTGGSLRACYDMITPKGLILVLKLIFYSLHFPSPVVLKPGCTLGLPRELWAPMLHWSAHHQINRIPWGLSTGRLKHSSHLKSELSWPFSLFLTVLSLFKVYLSPKWGLYFSKID